MYKKYPEFRVDVKHISLSNSQNRRCNISIYKPLFFLAKLFKKVHRQIQRPVNEVIWNGHHIRQDTVVDFRILEQAGYLQVEGRIFLSPSHYIPEYRHLSHIAAGLRCQFNIEIHTPCGKIRGTDSYCP